MLIQTTPPLYENNTIFSSLRNKHIKPIQSGGHFHYKRRRAAGMGYMNMNVYERVYFSLQKHINGVFT